MPSMPLAHLLIDKLFVEKPLHKPRWDGHDRAVCRNVRATAFVRTAFCGEP